MGSQQRLSCHHLSSSRTHAETSPGTSPCSQPKQPPGRPLGASLLLPVALALNTGALLQAPAAFVLLQCSDNSVGTTAGTPGPGGFHESPGCSCPLGQEIGFLQEPWQVYCFQPGCGCIPRGQVSSQCPSSAHLETQEQAEPGVENCPMCGWGPR